MSDTAFGYTADVAIGEQFSALMDTRDIAMVVATTAVGEVRAGCLVGFSTQCSIDPPRLLVFVSNKNRTYELAGQASILAVHFLAEDDRGLAELFGGETGDDVDKFAKCTWREVLGVPVLEECGRWVVGGVVDRYEPGDHAGLLLEPLVVGLSPGPGHDLTLQAVKDIDAGHDA